MSSIGASGPARVPEHRAHLHAAQAARPSGPAPRRSSHDLRPKLAAVPGMRVYPADPADHPHRRAAHQGRLPVHAAGRRPRRALPVGARPVRQDARSSPACRTSTPICRSRARRSWWTSTATRPPRSGSPPTRSRPRSATPTARGRSRRSTRRRTSTGSSSRSTRSTSRIPTALGRLLRARHQRQAGAARRGRQADAAGWARSP